MSLRYLDINPSPISEEGIYNKIVYVANDSITATYSYTENKISIYNNDSLYQSADFSICSEGYGFLCFINPCLSSYNINRKEFNPDPVTVSNYTGDLLFILDIIGGKIQDCDEATKVGISEYGLFSSFLVSISGIDYICKKDNQIKKLYLGQTQNIEIYSGEKLANLEGKNIFFISEGTTLSDNQYYIFKVGKNLYRYNCQDEFIDDNIILWGILPEDIDNFSLGVKVDSNNNFQEFYLVDFVNHKYYTAALTDTPPIPTPTPTLYTIRFLNYDGSELEVKEVEEGTTPSYTGATPSREGYTFTGWTPTLYPANKNQDYTAVYEKNKYTIRFLNYDESVLETKQVEYGVTPTYTGATPTREGYTFTGWNPALYPADKNQDYTAEFKQNARNITLILKTSNDDIISTSTYENVTNPITKIVVNSISYCYVKLVQSSGASFW